MFMNTRLNVRWEQNEYSNVGIIAVCYLSSLMNLIMDGRGKDARKQLTNTVSRGEKTDMFNPRPSFFFFLFTLSVSLSIRFSLRVRSGCTLKSTINIVVNEKEEKKILFEEGG